MENRFVDHRDNGYWVAGTSVSLDSIVSVFNQGLSPEAIVAECFSTLSLAQVYGAIAYYLAHKDETDAYLKQADAEYERLRQANHLANADIIRKLNDFRGMAELASS